MTFASASGLLTTAPAPDHGVARLDGPRKPATRRTSQDSLPPNAWGRRFQTSFGTRPFVFDQPPGRMAGASGDAPEDDAAGAYILPSLLLCDFGDLVGEIRRLEDAGIRALHLDVMDGHFVPNLTYGMPIVEGIRRHTALPVDVHLMISHPAAYAKQMIDAGADMVSFHVEADDDVAATVKLIKDNGAAAGIALNPDTPLSDIEPVLDVVDMILVMSVNAGFGGQKFNPVAIEKIQTLRHQGFTGWIEVDGGIDDSTIGPVRQAGCDLFVVGSAIFRKDDYGRAICDLRSAMRGDVQS